MKVFHRQDESAVGDGSAQGSASAKTADPSGRRTGAAVRRSALRLFRCLSPHPLQLQSTHPFTSISITCELTAQHFLEMHLSLRKRLVQFSTARLLSKMLTRPGMYAPTEAEAESCISSCPAVPIRLSHAILQCSERCGRRSR